jgi:hypothetical protein
MDEARNVIERLERIERLRAAGEPRAVLLLEVRRLLEEGEAWIAAETGETDRARGALDECRNRIDVDGEVTPAAA